MALTDQTFLQLITRLAHELNDAMSLAATSNGSTTTFVDNVNINSSRESYDGWEWFGTSSPNSDVIATVTTTSVSTITITPAVTSTTTGSTALLVNRRGRGFRIQDYKRAINGAIQDFNGLARIPVVETIAAVFDADTGTIAIPADLAEAYRVEWHVGDADFRLYLDDDPSENDTIPSPQESYGAGDFVLEATAGGVIYGGLAICSERLTNDQRARLKVVMENRGNIETALDSKRGRYGFFQVRPKVE